MTLHSDVEAGLRELAAGVKFDVPALGDGSMVRLTIPIPPALGAMRDGQIEIDVHVRPDGSAFTLSTPVAASFGKIPAGFLDALLRRQQRGHESGGLSYTLEADNQYDAVLAVYHWILPAITPDQFVALYQRFLTAALRVIADIDGMIDKASNIQRVHPVRS